MAARIEGTLRRGRAIWEAKSAVAYQSNDDDGEGCYRMRDGFYHLKCPFTDCSLSLFIFLISLNPLVPSCPCQRFAEIKRCSAGQPWTANVTPFGATTELAPVTWILGSLDWSYVVLTQQNGGEAAKGKWQKGELEAIHMVTPGRI